MKNKIKVYSSMLYINVAFKRQLCAVEDEDSLPPPSVLGFGHSLSEALLDQRVGGFSGTQAMRVLVFFVFLFSHGINGTM